MAKNGLNVRCLCQTGRTPRTGRILGHLPQNPIPRALTPRANPHFLWFASLQFDQRDAYTPLPMVTWWTHRAARPAHGGGEQWVDQGTPGENFFPKLFLDHLGCSNKCF